MTIAASPRLRRPAVRACLAGALALGMLPAAVVTSEVQDPPQEQIALPPPLGDPQGLLPVADGRDVVVGLCTRCHPADKVVSKTFVREDWEAVIGAMIMRGARLTDDEFGVVLEYMAAQFPLRVNVNKAPAEDMAAGFGLRFADATAIVDYREKNGPFKTLDDLRKVPNIEFKRIQIKRDAVIF